MIRRPIFLLVCCLLFSLGNATMALALEDRPNVLWLSAEDIGPHLGCYGYEIETPELDAFAGRSLRYRQAWSDYPVCAPARTTIITGQYATSLGAGNMRCEAAKPNSLKLLPELLRGHGYYCTNSSKTDYNLQGVADVWDQSSKKAHWKNRPQDKPFFSVFNYTGTHESRIRNRNHKQQIDPESVTLYPYWPDTPEVRKDWAQYLDNIQTLDAWFAEHLKALQDAGLAEDTIVFFWGDHGSGMPRHKRFAGDSGLRVPMVVHVPEKWRKMWSSEYQAGAVSDRLVSFVDLAPTVLKVAGCTVPESMQGCSFLGAEAYSRDFNYGFRSRMDERNDTSRSVTDGKFIYIRNYKPHLPHGQLLAYQQMTPTTKVWHQQFRDGQLNDIQSAFWNRKAKEELYDLAADPYETVNLAGQASYEEQLKRMRTGLRLKLLQIVDLDLVPESLLYDFEQRTGKPRSSYAHEEGFGMEALLNAAEGQSLAENLVSPRGELQYWAMVNLIGQQTPLSSPQQEAVSSLMSNVDAAAVVRVKAAEVALSKALFNQRAIETLVAMADMGRSNYYAAVEALGCLDRHRSQLDPDAIAKINKLNVHPRGIRRGDSYVERLVTRFATKDKN